MGPKKRFGLGLPVGQKAKLVEQPTLLEGLKDKSQALGAGGEAPYGAPGVVDLLQLFVLIAPDRPPPGGPGAGVGGGGEVERPVGAEGRGLDRGKAGKELFPAQIDVHRLLREQPGAVELEGPALIDAGGVRLFLRLAGPAQHLPFGPDRKAEDAAFIAGQGLGLAAVQRQAKELGLFLHAAGEVDVAPAPDGPRRLALGEVARPAPLPKRKPGLVAGGVLLSLDLGEGEQRPPPGPLSEAAEEAEFIEHLGRHGLSLPQNLTRGSERKGPARRAGPVWGKPLAAHAAALGTLRGPWLFRLDQHRQ